jgi:hypothetical protein
VNPDPFRLPSGFDDVLTGAAVLGAAAVAPEVLPALGAAADVGAGLATDAAVFASTPAGQVATSFATSQLGNTGLPPSNLEGFIGGIILPNLGGILNSLFGEEDAW